MINGIGNNEISTHGDKVAVVSLHETLLQLCETLHGTRDIEKLREDSEKRWSNAKRSQINTFFPGGPMGFEEGKLHTGMFKTREDVDKMYENLLSSPLP